MRAREGWEGPRRGGPVARDTFGHISALGPGCAQPHEPRKLCRRRLGSLGDRPKEADGDSKPGVRVREPQGGHGTGGAMVPSSRSPTPPRCGTGGLAQLAVCEVPEAARCLSLLGSRCEGLWSSPCPSPAGALRSKKKMKMVRLSHRGHPPWQLQRAGGSQDNHD